MTHWGDGARSDIDDAALLCQRHYTVVHKRRLSSEVRRKADELGRYAGVYAGSRAIRGTPHGR